MLNPNWNEMKDVEITELSEYNIEEVSGGNPIFVVIAISAFMGGYTIGKDHRGR